jgi:hypothetical protein
MRFIVLFGILALLAWCPWYEPTTAAASIEKAVSQQQVLNPKCKLTIQKNTFKKAWFGYSQVVAYDCTVAGFSDIAKGKNIVRATFIGIVLNVPNPVIK